MLDYEPKGRVRSCHKPPSCTLENTTIPPQLHLRMHTDTAGGDSPALRAAKDIAFGSFAGMVSEVRSIASCGWEASVNHLLRSSSILLIWSKSECNPRSSSLLHVSLGRSTASNPRGRLKEYPDYTECGLHISSAYDTSSLTTHAAGTARTSFRRDGRDRSALPGI